MLAGCAPTPNHAVTAWADGPARGKVLLTEHYALHTTIDDRAFRNAMAATMEASHRLYEQLVPAPTAPAAAERREGFVFAYRDEWRRHTSAIAGPEAEIFLRIHKGGYAHERMFATFFHGGPQTLAVCRHEGWHQHVALGFRSRPPPFLEEGLATLFEAGFEGGDVARPATNAPRRARLVEAVRRDRAWPLGTLLHRHAGNFIGIDWRQVDTFYAQAWALGHLLTSDPSYRPGLRRLLDGYANGSLAARRPEAAFAWAFERPFEQIEVDYQAHVRKLAGGR